MFDTGNNNDNQKNNITNKATTIATLALGRKKIAFALAAMTTIGICLIAFVVIFVVIIGGTSNGDINNDVSIRQNAKEYGFTIYDTSLSKSEFKQKIQDYANSHSQWQIFADYADDYYDYAKAKGVNPELVVVVAYKEHNGYTTGGANNYWGLACPNGSTSCKSYSSFMEGAKVLIDSAAKYDTLREWFEVGSYSYIGYFWYNLYLDRTGDGKTEAWGDGGCIYAEYIYPDGLPDRVAKACNTSNPTCDIQGTDYSDYQKWKNTGINPRTECTPTTDEDQSMYTTYLIKEQMGKARKNIFGLEFDEGISDTSSRLNISASSIVESYVQWMINFASDDTHGYSQSTRLMNPNVDCSSFVYYGLLKGAAFTEKELGGSYPFTTSNMLTPLKKIGFKVYKYTSEKDLQRGDILWYLGHTEVYVGNGQTVGAHTDRDGVDGDSSGTEINVANNWADSKWTSYIRYEGNN